MKKLKGIGKVGWLWTTGNIFLFLFVSCIHQPSEIKERTNIGVSNRMIEYAEGFDLIDKGNGQYLVKVFHPDQKEKLLFSCTIYPEKDTVIPDESGLVVRSPMDSIAVFSATQLNGLALLGALDRVVGVSESTYITNAYIKQRLAEGKTYELGNNGVFFVERTLALRPQAIFYSPYQVNQAHPLAATQQVMIPFLDFMETNPLGRAEWIKFTAAFTGNLPKADSLFQSIVDSYDSLKALASRVKNRPTVMSDKYFADQWYVPGGQSYMAVMLADAGGEYIWKNDDHRASFPLDVETVLSKASKADFWRIVGSYDGAPAYEQLASENELYIHFDAFKNHRVIFCDSRKTGYFERGALEPQVQLADLIFAFHPELLPDYIPVYYQIIP